VREPCNGEAHHSSFDVVKVWESGLLLYGHLLLQTSESKMIYTDMDR
jgi:hypothetical protein